MSPGHGIGLTRGGHGKETALPRHVVILDAAGLGGADLETVDALARLGLVVRRCGSMLRIENAPDDLAELLRLAGLVRALGVQPTRQPEERSKAVGVHEERQPVDPVAGDLPDPE